MKFERTDGPVAEFTVDPPSFGTGQEATFTAKESPHAQYTWLFGDGTEAHGRKVKHAFPDADGTDLDGLNGAGRFRVMLRVRDKKKHEDWASQGVVVVSKWMDAAQTGGANHARGWGSASIRAHGRNFRT